MKRKKYINYIYNKIHISKENLKFGIIFIAIIGVGYLIYKYVIPYFLLNGFDMIPEYRLNTTWII